MAVGIPIGKINNKMDKAPPARAGNIACLDAAGQPYDGGSAPSDFAPSTIRPDQHQTFNQDVASNVWTIPHAFGRRPNVRVFDSAGDECMGLIDYPDANTIRVTFSAMLAGFAELT